MVDVPDRLGELIQRIEAGEPITQELVDRIAMLQTLDLVKVGRDFTADAIKRDREHITWLESVT